MSRIVLIHWQDAEAKGKARWLNDCGHETRVLSDSEKTTLERIRNSPPDLFVIDLNRLPSHGREIAGYFRRIKATRQVPILFVDGDPERIKKARDLIPDADFAKWDEIKHAIPKAIRKAPRWPVVPGTMAGYSGTPLPKKLGIREQYGVLLVNAPHDLERRLGPLPEGAEFVGDPAEARVTLLFANSEAELARDFRPLVKVLPANAALWIAWPKKASGIRTDLSENVVRETVLASGWVDYKVCAIDETWSGLCFARRK